MPNTNDFSPLAQAMGRVPTGLYLVATRNETGPIAFVGSFLMQVGFEPPTVSIAVGRDREHLVAMRQSGRFAVSILDEKSSHLMGPFFKRYEDGGSAFDHVEHARSGGGMPIFPASLAWLDCKLSAEADIGDHVVVFGVVEEGALLREGDPSIHLRQNGLAY